jgi:hypothetical protein
MRIVVTGACLLILLMVLTGIGKKIREPFTTIPKENSDVLLDFPLQPVIQAQPVNYGDLRHYVSQTPMASYAQVTNNRRDWKNPENGSALFPPINGTSIYK